MNITSNATLLITKISFFSQLCILILFPSITSAQTPFTVEAPPGLPPVPIPEDNPMTVEKVELGKMLYFDPRLSGDNSVSCSSCHMPEHGYAELKPLSQGIDNHTGPRNANTVINTAYATRLFWDGRAKDLESQASAPIENLIEMGSEMNTVVADINNISEYKQRFMQVFGEPASKETITKAIAAFERTIVSGNSPYDKYQNGDETAMSQDAIKGMQLFNGRALCASCHAPPLFSNWSFHNAGIGMNTGNPDSGRIEITSSPNDKGKFRVPHLRNVTDTAPYFHNGSVQTLEEAIRIMATGGIDNPNLDPVFRAIKMQKITEQEIKQITAFIKALSGEYPVIDKPKLPGLTD